MRDEVDELKREVRLRQGSEEQMKQVLAEYEKTISELIAEKEKDLLKFNEEKARVIGERDQVRRDSLVYNVMKDSKSVNNLFGGLMSIISA